MLSESQQKRNNAVKKKFEEIMAENFSNLVKDLNLQTEEVQWTWR